MFTICLSLFGTAQVSVGLDSFGTYVISVFSTSQEITLPVKSKRLYNRSNYCGKYCPCPRSSHVAESWPQPLFHVLWCTSEFPNKKIENWERNNIIARIDGLSATQNGRAAAQTYSTLQESNPGRLWHCLDLLFHMLFGTCRSVHMQYFHSETNE